MKRIITSMALCLLAVKAEAVAIIPTGPTITVFDGETSHILEGSIVPGSKLGESVFELAAPVSFGGANGFEITSLDVEFNQDPFITYGLAVNDLGAPSTFGFSFNTPIVPTSNPASVKSTYAASFTDANDGKFSLTPPASDPDGDGFAEVQTFQVFDGTFKNAGVDLGRADTFTGAVGASGTIPAEAAGPIAAPAGGPFTALQLNVDFSLSGNGDIYTANGRGELVTRGVPETGSTLSLLGIAGLGLGACLRIRRK